MYLLDHCLDASLVRICMFVCILYLYYFLSVFVSISVFVLYQAGSLVYHCLDASFVCICAPPDGKLVEINGSLAIKTKLCSLSFLSHKIARLKNFTSKYQVLCILQNTFTNIWYPQIHSCLLTLLLHQVRSWKYFILFCEIKFQLVAKLISYSVVSHTVN